MKKILLILVLFMAGGTTYSLEKKKLLDFRYNKYSQFGEDGIIQKIFEVIGTTSKLCIEFGASDGFFCSNTARLWKEYQWKAILIEPDKKAFRKLQKNIQGYNCIAVNTYVGIHRDDSLDFLINSKLKIKEEIDLLSIDVDGNDYYIFESIKKIRPRLIICEYNTNMPAELDIYTEYTFCSDYRNNQIMGCSVGALCRLAKEKNYQLVAITDSNCFFVDSAYIDKFQDFELELHKIKIDDYIKYVIFDYIGRPLLIGKTPKFGHGIQKGGFSPWKVYNNQKLNYATARIKKWDVDSPYVR